MSTAFVILNKKIFFENKLILKFSFKRFQIHFDIFTQSYYLPKTKFVKYNMISIHIMSLESNLILQFLYTWIFLVNLFHSFQLSLEIVVKVMLWQRNAQRIHEEFLKYKRTNESDFLFQFWLIWIAVRTLPATFINILVICGLFICSFCYSRPKNCIFQKFNPSILALYR